MTQKDALNLAKGLNAAINDSDRNKFFELVEEIPNSDVREFVKSLLNTYIDVHTPKPEQNFVKNWQDSHEDKKILDFGPTEDEDFQDDEGDSPIIININIDKLIW